MDMKSETTLLKLNVVFLMGLSYLKQIICGSEFWKYEGQYLQWLSCTQNKNIWKISKND